MAMLVYRMYQKWLELEYIFCFELVTGLMKNSDFTKPQQLKMSTQQLKTLKNKRKYRVWFFAFPKKWSFHLLQAWHRENHPETRSQTPENSTFQGGCHINRSWCCSTSTTCNILVRWSIFHHQWVGLTTSIQKWKSQKTLLITWDRNHNKYLPQVEFDCSWSLVYNFHALIPHLAGEFRI